MKSFRRHMECLLNNRTYIISFLIFFLSTLGIFILLQPKQGHNPRVGFNLEIYDTHNTCFHIHHWVYMMFLFLYTTVIVVISKGMFNEMVLALLGFLLGGSFSDLAYRDFYRFIVKC